MNAVLNLLQNGEYRPSDLVKLLLDQGFEESDVKESVAELLHDQQVQLSPSRYLHVAVVAA